MIIYNNLSCLTITGPFFVILSTVKREPCGKDDLEAVLLVAQEPQRVGCSFTPCDSGDMAKSPVSGTAPGT